MPHSNRLVFLDIGGHLGQTLDEVLRPEYAFDHIYTFEPMRELADRLSSVYTEHVEAGRLTVNSFGLSNKTADVTLYGDNEGGGASTFATKKNISDSVHTSVRMLRASDFFREHLLPDDVVLMKLNCEGAEGEILIDLIEADYLGQLADIMIDFDLFKIPGRRHEPFQVMKRLRGTGFVNFHLAKDAMVGNTHQKRIRNWLSQAKTTRPLTSDPHLFAHLPIRRNPLKRALWAIRMRLLGSYDLLRAH